MKNTGKCRRILYMVMLSVLAAFFCTACTKSLEDRTSSGELYYYPENTQGTQSVQEDEESGDLFLLLSIDNLSETMRLYRYSNGLEYQYYYGLDTRFLDKYGKSVSAAGFVPGKAVYIGNVDTAGKLTEIRIADDVWEYDNISRFAVEEERNIFYIADTKYNYDEHTFFFSDSKRIGWEDISSDDTLSVIGKDKKILSVRVTTGHGFLQLTNTELFEGSYLQLDTRIFAEITPQMQLEIPEGTYTLSVANDGWGGSCEITINRGEVTIVDLDTIKGEGPKYGTILFAIDIEGAKLKIDGKTVDYSQPMELRYGWHSLAVSADGYDDWSKYLYVNSEEATIVIELEEESTSGTSDNSVTDDTDSDADDADSEDANAGDDDDADTNSDTLDELLEDYLSTLTKNAIFP